MKNTREKTLPLGLLALILSKHYYGVLSKSLEVLDVDRYYSVLYYLSLHNGCNQQQICNALAVDKTAMVKVMDYLNKAGYLVRKVNPSDRREHFINLTAKGRKKTELVSAAFETIDKAIFAAVKKQDKNAFYKMMEHLLQNLKTHPAHDLFFNYKKTRAAGNKAADKKNNS